MAITINFVPWDFEAEPLAQLSARSCLDVLVEESECAVSKLGFPDSSLNVDVAARNRFCRLIQPKVTNQSTCKEVHVQWTLILQTTHYYEHLIIKYRSHLQPELQRNVWEQLLLLWTLTKCTILRVLEKCQGNQKKMLVAEFVSCVYMYVCIKIL